MGKLIILKPGALPEIVDHDGRVKNEDIYRLGEFDTFDCRSLDTIPGSHREGMIWFDDNGLMNDKCVANRRVISGRMLGPIICGTIIVSALKYSEDGLDAWALEDNEAAVCLEHVSRWDMLHPLQPKPEPEFVLPVRR